MKVINNDAQIPVMCVNPIQEIVQYRKRAVQLMNTQTTRSILYPMSSGCFLF